MPMRFAAQFRNLLLTCCCMVGLYLPAQRIVLRQLTPEDGLSGSEVYDLAQDVDGNMWFATNKGLCRYDGYEFKTYTAQDGIDGNDVIKLFPDTQGRLWFSTYADHINYVENDRLHTSHNDSRVRQIPTARVYRCMAAHPDGTRLFGARFLTVVNLEKGDFRQFALPAKAFEIQSILPTAFPNRFRIFSPKQEYIFDLETTQFTFARHLPEETGGALQLQNGTVVLFGRDYVRIESATDTLTYAVSEVMGPGLSVLRMAELPEGRLAFCTTGGAFVFEGTRLNEGLVARLAEGVAVSSILEDREGLLWLSTLEQGVMLGGRQQIQSYTKADGLPIAYALGRDAEGAIWVGGGKGQYYRIRKGELSTFQLDVAGRFRGGRQRLLNISFTEDEVGEDVMLMAGDGGFITRKKGRESYHDLKGVKWVVARDPYRRYLGSPRLFSYDKRTQPHLQTQTLKQSNKYVEVHSTRLIWDEKERPVVSCTKGLLRWPNEASLLAREAPDTLLSMSLRDMAYTERHFWGCGWNGGAVLFTPDTLLRIGRAEGLSSELGNCIEAVGPWEAWLGTPMGLNHICVNPRTYAVEVRVVDVRQGLNGNEVHDILVHADTVWAATARGLSFFRASALQRREHPPLLRLRRIVVADRDTVLEGPIQTHHRAAGLQFDVSAAGFANEQPPVFHYKMTGLDRDWQVTAQRFIRYPNIPPGDYTFEIFAKAVAGPPSPVLRIAVSVAPPWWTRAWAIAGIALLANHHVLGAFALRIRILQRRHRLEMQLLVAEQKALRAQMNPHFLFNALNAIQGFFMRQKTSEGNHYLKKFSLMIRRILENSEKMWVSIE
ncbi:MAG: two-component regulator propeller domain-containing protein, partial [Bacteroidota bacterium]